MFGFVKTALNAMTEGLASIGEGLASILSPRPTRHRVERYWTLTENGRTIYHGTSIPQGFEKDFEALSEDFDRIAADWDRIGESFASTDPLDAAGFARRSKRAAERMRRQANRLRKRRR